MLNILDQTAINAVNIVQTPLLDNIMIFFTTLGDCGIIWIILSVILLLKKKTRNTGIIMIISIISVSVLTNYLKGTFDRIRPYEYLHFIPKIKTSGTSSFPSAHSAVAFAVFGISYFYHLKYRYITGVFALIVAVSRFYLGVHYFTDVLAGIFIGFAVSGILFYMSRIIMKYLKKIFYLKKSVLSKSLIQIMHQQKIK